MRRGWVAHTVVRVAACAILHLRRDHSAQWSLRSTLVPRIVGILCGVRRCGDGAAGEGGGGAPRAAPRAAAARAAARAAVRAAARAAARALVRASERAALRAAATTAFGKSYKDNDPATKASAHRSVRP